MQTRISSLLVGLVVLWGAVHRATAEDIVVQSPDGNVQFKLMTDGGRLKCSATIGGKSFLDPSTLEFIIDGVDLSQGIEVGKPQSYSQNEKYPWRGVHSEANNRANGVTIPIKHAASNSAYTLEIRAFNDAVAFRHTIEGSDKPRVPDEGSTLVVPAGSTIWHHGLEGHYEDQHEKTAVADMKAGDWVAPPMTYKLPDGIGYASMTEAALMNYPGMAFQADGQRGFQTKLAHSHPISHPYRLRYTPEDIERVSKPAQISGTITTPWRLVMVAKDLNTLVNSDAVPNLCPPPDKTLFPQGLQTGWIKPGRAVWDYLDRAEAPRAADAPAAPAEAPAGGARAPGAPGGGGFRRSPEESLKAMKEFTDLAAQLGFEHNILEGFWTGWTDEQIRDLVKYANERNVKIWVWRSARGRSAQFAQGRGGNQAGQNPAPGAAPAQSGAAPAATPAPGQTAQSPNTQNPAGATPGGASPPGRGGGGFMRGPQSAYNSGPMSDPKVRHEFIKHLHDLGISGIKIDFFDHEAKEVIDTYQGILKEAAENQMLVDFHGANKPTGESRTWPNEMTREAVRGMENRRMQDRATHGVTLPFTRWLAGPAEYTPVHFGERMGNTTAAHQTASAAILSAPVLTYAANPATLLASPAVEMFKSIPSTWDQTIVLPPSEIGELALFARRKGDVWFLAAMNNPNAKMLEVPLSFLGPGKYEALLVRDSAEDPASMKLETTGAGQGDSMKIDLRPGGGFIGRFTKTSN